MKVELENDRGDEQWTGKCDAEHDNDDAYDDMCLGKTTKGDADNHDDGSGEIQWKDLRCWEEVRWWWW